MDLITLRPAEYHGFSLNTELDSSRMEVEDLTPKDEGGDQAKHEPLVLDDGGALVLLGMEAVVTENDSNCLEDPCKWFSEPECCNSVLESMVYPTCGEEQSLEETAQVDTDSSAHLPLNGSEFGNILNAVFDESPKETVGEKSWISRNCSETNESPDEMSPGVSAGSCTAEGATNSTQTNTVSSSFPESNEGGSEAEPSCTGFRDSALVESLRRNVHKRPLMSAVDVARQAAESAAQDSLRAKQCRDAASLSAIGSDISDEREAKKQKRLQKNRNSAFVSRIRQREYSYRLAESLKSEESRNVELLTERSLLLERIRVLKDEAFRVGSELAAANNSISRALGPIAPRKEVGVTSLLLVICLFGCMIPGLQPVHRHGGPSGSNLKMTHKLEPHVEDLVIAEQDPACGPTCDLAYPLVAGAKNSGSQSVRKVFDGQSFIGSFVDQPSVWDFRVPDGRNESEEGWDCFNEFADDLEVEEYHLDDIEEHKRPFGSASLLERKELQYCFEEHQVSTMDSVPNGGVSLRSSDSNSNAIASHVA
uniref:BZIP domain-containing protein n=1 Tax=Erythrolobus madagascarensis TaxID=708628 RepID=A0A6T9YX64_9RHOD